MTVASGADVPLLNSHDLQLLSDHTCNVVLEGPVTAIEVVLNLLQSHLRAPIVSHQSHAPLEFPSSDTRTLILRDAAALNGDAQRRLLARIDDAGAGTQIISTTERPLFPLVAKGLFDARLYYRLNVMLLRVGPNLRLLRSHRWRTAIKTSVQ
jgi:hypothetical protein